MSRQVIAKAATSGGHHHHHRPQQHQSGQTQARAGQTKKKWTHSAFKRTHPTGSEPLSVGLPYDGKGIIYRNLKYIDDQPSLQMDSKLTVEKLRAQNYVDITTTPLQKQSVIFTDRVPQYPMLNHGLDKVMKNYGLHPMRDERGEFLFPRFLAKCPQPSEVNHAAFPRFVTSSKDKILHSIALKLGAKFKGSTSSVSGIMSHCYYLLSRHKTVRQSHVSSFKFQPMHFTPAAVKPVSFFLRHNEGTYSIDRDGGSKPSDNAVLMDMGRILEHLLTTPYEEFKRRFLLHDGQNDSKPTAGSDSCYNYLFVDNNLLLRSQLDCWHPDVGIVDIKTRATYAIRMHVAEWQDHTYYKLDKLTGNERSFEREFYDMTRAAFLKYIFQCRIGSMAGVFVAYHNTQEMFGFEFLSLKEMEYAVFQSQALADLTFDVSCKMLSQICEHVTSRFPAESLRLILQTQTNLNHSQMTIFVERLSSTQPVILTDSAHPMAEQTQETLRKQIFESTNPIHKYIVNIQTAIDGKVTSGQLHLRDHHDAQVFLKIEEDTTTAKSKMMEEYMQMVRDSSLHVMPDEVDKQNQPSKKRK